MIDNITVHKDGVAIYDIIFRESFSYLEDILLQCGTIKHRICVVSDSNVAPLYMEQVKAVAEKCGSFVTDFVFPAGEENKNLDTVNSLYLNLIQSKFDRNDFLLALGGGVVGDLTGFTAATYLRGIKFIQVPTTLLSMVDSSIGGKTGVDYKGYKNMVGAFYQPLAVYMNLSTLQTLSDKQYYSGFGEIIKHGLIQDAAYYQELENHKQGIPKEDLSLLSKIIYRSCNIKKDVVEQDPMEKGIRAFLNFGHTIGHAIEKELYKKYLHGECVSLGIVAACFICCQRGMLSNNEFDAIQRCLSAYQLPIRETQSGLSKERILETTRNDKKMIADKIKFVLIDGIGNAKIDTSVSDEEMLQAIGYVLGEYCENKNMEE